MTTYDARLRHEDTRIQDEGAGYRIRTGAVGDGNYHTASVRAGGFDFVELWAEPATAIVTLSEQQAWAWVEMLVRYLLRRSDVPQSEGLELESMVRAWATQEQNRKNAEAGT